MKTDNLEEMMGPWPLKDNWPYIDRCLSSVNTWPLSIENPGIAHCPLVVGGDGVQDTFIFILF